MTTGDTLAAANSALAEGRWVSARDGFEAALADAETADALFGSAMARWWLGDNHGSVERSTRAYTLFRRAGDDAHAAQCATWLAITYKANFANFPAANGWLGRADRLLAGTEPGVAHGWCGSHGRTSRTISRRPRR